MVIMEKLWRERKRIWCGLPWTFTVYSFTEDRIFIETGVLTTREDEVRMYRVLDIGMTRTLVQRIFGLSTIELSTSDKSMGNFILKNIKNGHEVKEQLSELIEQSRAKNRVTSREFMAEAPDDDME
jgi:uncharacterized membrane protein YdbT with pleckstrin-like domain